MADPGKGPEGPEGPEGPARLPLFLDKTEAQRAENVFFATAPLRISGSGGPPPPPLPLSEGPNPPLYSHANKTHFHMKGFELSLVMKVTVFEIRHRKRREI